jgi:hypothetical protein
LKDFLVKQKTKVNEYVVIYVMKIEALSGMALVLQQVVESIFFLTHTNCHPSHQILYKAKISKRIKILVETFDYLASKK